MSPSHPREMAPVRKIQQLGERRPGSTGGEAALSSDKETIKENQCFKINLNRRASGPPGGRMNLGQKSLPQKIHFRVATASQQRLIVLGMKTLQGGPGFYQGADHLKRSSASTATL
jgi:hypothetical protein